MLALYEFMYVGADAYIGPICRVLRGDVGIAPYNIEW